jgi:predicted nucleic acid-binding Zn ribbon protein
MRKLDQMLPDSIGRDEVLRAARAQKILRRWEEVVGPALAAKSQPDRYERGTVWVAVTGSAWAQELRMKRDQLLSRLRELAGEPTLFTDMRFGQRPMTLSTPETPAEDPVDRTDELKDLSIREIAEQRLKKWKGR